MKSTFDTQETVVQSCGRDAEPVAPVYVEKTPCVVIPAVSIAFDIARPRTMHAWLT
jgi:hypothetical protein